MDWIHVGGTALKDQPINSEKKRLVAMLVESSVSIKILYLWK